MVTNSSVVLELSCALGIVVARSTKSVVRAIDLSEEATFLSATMM
jgi:hypothetical protein